MAIAEAPTLETPHGCAPTPSIILISLRAGMSLSASRSLALSATYGFRPTSMLPPDSGRDGSVISPTWSSLRALSRSRRKTNAKLPS